MKTMILAAAALMLFGATAIAQPRDRRDDHRAGPPSPAAPAHGPAVAPRPVGGGPARSDVRNRPGNNRPADFRGRPGFAGPRPGGHRLPPGIRAPRDHDRAPMWRGRAWAVGDLFVLRGFRGPTIFNVGDYGLPPARPGTHWIYVDGWYLMVGNRTGRIFDEVPADY